MANDIQPDLILLDIMMPFMDGFEICRKLKSNALTNNISLRLALTSGLLENHQVAFQL
jgi:Response regulator containing a CheY-like receiver domain and a GGDEF domain